MLLVMILQMLAPTTNPLKTPSKALTAAAGGGGGCFCRCRCLK
jgi:hypothetical protein